MYGVHTIKLLCGRSMEEEGHMYVAALQIGVSPSQFVGCHVLGELNCMYHLPHSFQFKRRTPKVL